jgi:hypothetical protein
MQRNAQQPSVQQSKSAVRAGCELRSTHKVRQARIRSSSGSWCDVVALASSCYSTSITAAAGSAAFCAWRAMISGRKYTCMAAQPANLQHQNRPQDSTAALRSNSLPADSFCVTPMPVASRCHSTDKLSSMNKPVRERQGAPAVLQLPASPCQRIAGYRAECIQLCLSPPEQLSTADVPGRTGYAADIDCTADTTESLT